MVSQQYKLENKNVMFITDNDIDSISKYKQHHFTTQKLYKRVYNYCCLAPSKQFPAKWCSEHVTLKFWWWYDNFCFELHTEIELDLYTARSPKQQSTSRFITSIHSNTLSWIRAIHSLLLFRNAASLLKKTYNNNFIIFNFIIKLPSL